MIETRRNEKKSEVGIQFLVLFCKSLFVCHSFVDYFVETDLNALSFITRVWSMASYVTTLSDGVDRRWRGERTSFFRGLISIVLSLFVEGIRLHLWECVKKHL